MKIKCLRAILKKKKNKLALSHRLSNMAMARYDVIKAQTTAGMLHMMDERKYADIEVNLMPSYIIVPATGELRK